MVPTMRHPVRMAVSASPPTRTTTPITRAAAANPRTSHSGRASSPRSRSDAKPTNVSPNNQLTRVSSTSDTAATARRSTSAGDRSTRCVYWLTTVRLGIELDRSPVLSCRLGR